MHLSNEGNVVLLFTKGKEMKNETKCYKDTVVDH